jgi:two-component system, response regulator RegA
MSGEEAPSFLVVDDDDRLADRLGVALLERGHPVRVAYDGARAVALAREEAPDRVVLDLRMPGEDGLSVLRQLLEVAPRARVVLLTGYSSLPVAVDAVKLGAVGVLQKPAEPEGILAAFEREPGGEAPAYTPPSLARAEWEHIQRVLADCDGNISEAARRLGLHRRTLQRKLRKRPPRS